MLPDPTEETDTTGGPPGPGRLLLELDRARLALEQTGVEKLELEAKLRSADRRIDALLRQLEEANTRLEAALSRLEVLSRQLEATNRQLDEAQRGEAELRGLLAHAQSQLDSLLPPSSDQ